MKDLFSDSKWLAYIFIIGGVLIMVASFFVKTDVEKESTTDAKMLALSNVNDRNAGVLLLALGVILLKLR